MRNFNSDAPAARRAGPVVLFCLGIIWFTTGCDQLDPSLLIPGSGDSAEVGSNDGTSEGANAALAGGETSKSAAPAAGKRAKDMFSIESGDSLRVYYQFVDDRGRVQFVERLSDVPEAWRNRVGYVEMAQAPPLTPVEARRSWTLSASRTQEILLAKGSSRSSRGSGGRQTGELLLYSADWCGACRTAKAHLDREGVDYEELNVDIKENAAELREKVGRGGIPVLDFEGEILRGYSKPQYDKVIDQVQS